MAVELDRVLPLPQAAKQMGMTVEALTRLVLQRKVSLQPFQLGLAM
jgi:hypothetical protein